MRTRSAALPALLVLATLSACNLLPGSDVQKRKAARTAEAPGTILRTETVVRHDYDDMTVDTLHKVVWQFEADGRTYTDSVPATLYIPSEQYKVCYDPADPENSSIEFVDISCARTP